MGKMYRLGRQIPPAKGIGGKFKRAVAAPFDWLTAQMRDPTDEEVLWALKNVSFEIKRGEVVGFIGHNGAGKSTLLKILSRITEPTTGHAEIHGRIAALLEVGTGMHPELTGRENIFMNGTVLGMKKVEIDRKFDEIIEFSGIEKFLDTPVKRYSSGMRVRLGFAIAAHLEPEILVVDEVLAVGDADFQKKCLGKMRSVAGTGRTVIFVSHKMAAVENLCSRACLLAQGQMLTSGETRSVIDRYLSVFSEGNQDTEVVEDIPRNGSLDVIFSGFQIENQSGRHVNRISTGEDTVFVFRLKVNVDVARNVDLGFSIHASYGEVIATFYSSYVGKNWEFRGEREVTIRCSLKKLALSPGRYFVKGRILVNGIEADWPKSPIGVLDVNLGGFYGTETHVEGLGGVLLLDGSWD